MSFDFTTTCRNHEVRRQDRLMEAEPAQQLLERGEFGFLAMQAEEGGGYGLPLSYAWDGERGAVYIHCAPEGRKLRCLRAEPRVTFCIVGHTQPLPAQFTTLYESLLLFGTVAQDLAEDERMHALHLLVAKYAPEHIEVGHKYAQDSFHRTHILRLDIASWSAKAKRPK